MSGRSPAVIRDRRAACLRASGHMPSARWAHSFRTLRDGPLRRAVKAEFVEVVAQYQRNVVAGPACQRYCRGFRQHHSVDHGLKPDEAVIIQRGNVRRLAGGDERRCRDGAKLPCRGMGGAPAATAICSPSVSFSVRLRGGRPKPGVPLSAMALANSPGRRARAFAARRPEPLRIRRRSSHSPDRRRSGRYWLGPSAGRPAGPSTRNCPNVRRAPGGTGSRARRAGTAR